MSAEQIEGGNEAQRAREEQKIHLAPHIGAVELSHADAESEIPAEPLYQSDRARATLDIFLNRKSAETIAAMTDEVVQRKIDDHIAEYQDSPRFRPNREYNESAVSQLKDWLLGVDDATIKDRYKLASVRTVGERRDKVCSRVRELIRDKQRAGGLQGGKGFNQPKSYKIKRRPPKPIEELKSFEPYDYAKEAPLGQAITAFAAQHDLSNYERNTLIIRFDPESEVEYKPVDETIHALDKFADATEQLNTADSTMFTPLEIEAVARLTGRDKNTAGRAKTLTFREYFIEAEDKMSIKLARDDRNLAQVLEQVFTKLSQPR